MALNTSEVELVYRLERMKEQVVVKLDDDSAKTSTDVDGKKRRLLALGSAATPLFKNQSTRERACTCIGGR